MDILQKIYALPLRTVVMIMFMAIVLWVLASRIPYIPYKKFWRILNICCFTASIAAIMYKTLFSRTPGSYNQLILIPFYSFAEAKIQPEMYRSMLMNCLMFLPFGLTLPFALPKNQKHKFLTTVLSAMTLSLLIELSQYIFSLGRAEVDDIICNTLGAAFGGVSYILSQLLRQPKQEQF